MLTQALRKGAEQMSIFAESSKAVFFQAQDLAIELGSRYLSVGHLLYGCAEVRDETAGGPLRECGITAVAIRRILPRTAEQPAEQADPEVLSSIGIDYGGVRAAVDGTFGAGALESAPDRRVSITRTCPPTFTPNAKRTLELSLRTAQELHHHNILPGHLLLGLLRLDDELVSNIIEQSCTTVAALSAAVLTSLAVVV